MLFCTAICSTHSAALSLTSLPHSSLTDIMGHLLILQLLTLLQHNISPITGSVMPADKRHHPCIVNAIQRLYKQVIIPKLCCLAGMQPHASLSSSFHLTVFMTSQPGDPRPDPFTSGGGIDPMHPPVAIPAASAATLQREIDACRQIALTVTPAFEVQCCELLFISANIIIVGVFTNTDTLFMSAALAMVLSTGSYRIRKLHVRRICPVCDHFKILNVHSSMYLNFFQAVAHAHAHARLALTLISMLTV